MNVCDFHAYTVGGYPNCAHPGCKAIGDNCLVAGSPDRYCGTHYDEIRKHNAEQKCIVLETLVGKPNDNCAEKLRKAYVLIEEVRAELGLYHVSVGTWDTFVNISVFPNKDTCDGCNVSHEDASRDGRKEFYEAFGKLPLK